MVCVCAYIYITPFTFSKALEWPFFARRGYGHQVDSPVGASGSPADGHGRVVSYILGSSRGKWKELTKGVRKLPSTRSEMIGGLIFLSIAVYRHKEVLPYRGKYLSLCFARHSNDQSKTLCMLSLSPDPCFIALPRLLPAHLAFRPLTPSSRCPAPQPHPA